MWKPTLWDSGVIPSLSKRVPAGTPIENLERTSKQREENENHLFPCVHRFLFKTYRMILLERESEERDRQRWPSHGMHVRKEGTFPRRAEIGVWGEPALCGQISGARDSEAAWRTS